MASRGRSRGETGNRGQIYAPFNKLELCAVPVHRRPMHTLRLGLRGKLRLTVGEVAAPKQDAACTGPGLTRIF